MASIAKGLAVQDIEAISSYLAAQPMPADSRPMDARAANTAAQECGGTAVAAGVR
jgi:cytochrome c553